KRNRLAQTQIRRVIRRVVFIVLRRDDQRVVFIRAHILPHAAIAIAVDCSQIRIRPLIAPRPREEANFAEADAVAAVGSWLAVVIRENTDFDGIRRMNAAEIERLGRGSRAGVPQRYWRAEIRTPVSRKRYFEVLRLVIVHSKRVVAPDDERRQAEKAAEVEC